MTVVSVVVGKRVGSSPRGTGEGTRSLGISSNDRGDNVVVSLVVGIPAMLPSQFRTTHLPLTGSYFGFGFSWRRNASSSSF